MVLVHRLREVSAQVGFTRFEAAVTDIHGDIPNDMDLQVRRAPLALDSSWRPAIENRGEGIFIQFRAEAVNSWAGRDEIVKRGELLMEGFDDWKADHKNSSREFPRLQYYLFHSIFAWEFREKHWPWPDLPEVYYDPRSLSLDQHQRSSTHAKCVIADGTKAIITSVNFTEAAWLRNIEVGVVVKHEPLVSRLADYVDGLIARRFLFQCQL